MKTEFEKSFAKETKGLVNLFVGFIPTCEECLQKHEICCEHMAATLEISEEGSFSHSQCDGCSSELGGNRYSAHGICIEDSDFAGEILHMDVCEDCVQYIANGEIPEDWRRE